jgi:nucleoside 2-deoxyribosyltransferase
MATKNRIFISFAIEDSNYRTMLVGQARHEQSPFEFVDMSVKEPWDEKWKTNCRTRIKGCDGVIALVSKNTARADGALWEVSCALDEGIPVIALHCTQDNRPQNLPAEFRSITVADWTWKNIARYIDSL